VGCNQLLVLVLIKTDWCCEARSPLPSLWIIRSLVVCPIDNPKNWSTWKAKEDLAMTSVPTSKCVLSHIILYNFFTCGIRATIIWFRTLIITCFEFLIDFIRFYDLCNFYLIIRWKLPYETWRFFVNYDHTNPTISKSLFFIFCRENFE